MNATLDAWNKADEPTARATMLACCGARRWTDAMVSSRPIADVFALSAVADRIWATMTEPDWLEAFASHPRIGSQHPAQSHDTSVAWAQEEQSSTLDASTTTLDKLAAGNALYEERFGFTYIVCATGKSAEEMLAILERRLTHTRDAELREAAEQQRQITQIRLGKWLIQ